MRKLALLAFATATLVLVSALPALALPGLTIGFSAGADPYVATGNPLMDAPWIARAHSVGAQMIRLDVQWSAVAPGNRPAGFNASNPASPGYDWTRVDAQVRELSAAGFRILIDIWTAPTWAEGPDQPSSAPAGTWRPSEAAFGAFATAIATRYDGHFQDPLNPGTSLPRVSDWQGWNEPNLAVYLTPQWIRAPRTHRFVAESPVLYRALQNAFYASVKRVESSNFVVQAGTAPYGDVLPGLSRIPPVAFDRSLFCLNGDLKRLSCPDPVHFDALDNHPYGIYGPTWHALNADDVAVPDVYKLMRVLQAAERAGTVLPAGPKQSWVTEISWDTNPPNPQAVAAATVARWLEQSFYALWSQGVNTVLWLQLADSPPVPNYADVYEAGIYFLSGQAKPGATAFRFPFLTNRIDTRHIEVWGRAPVAGVVSVERLEGRSWQVIGRLAVNSGAVFELRLPLSGHASLRGQEAGRASLAWTQGG